MPLKFRHKTDRNFVIEWDGVYVPDFIRETYEEVKEERQSIGISGKMLVPVCGWDKLTLENFEENMGYSFRMEKDDTMRGISREVAFLEFLESKGIDRKTRLIAGLTLDNFAEKVGHRFRRTAEDMDRGISKERAFEMWKKRMGYN